MDAIRQILSSDTNRTPERYAELATPDTVQFVSAFLDADHDESDDIAANERADILLSGTSDELRMTLLAADKIKSVMKDIRSYDDKVHSRTKWYHLLAAINDIHCGHPNDDGSTDSHGEPTNKLCDECDDLKQSSPTRVQIVNAIEQFPSFIMTHIFDPDNTNTGLFVITCSFVIDGKCINIGYSISVMGEHPTDLAIVIDGKMIETYDRASLHGRMIDFYSNSVNFLSHFHLIRDGYFDRVHTPSEINVAMQGTADNADEQTLDTDNQEDDKLDNATAGPSVLPPRPTLKYYSPRDVFVDLYPDRDVTMFDRVDELTFEKGDPNSEWLSEAVAHTNKVWTESLTDYKRRVAEWRDKYSTSSRNKDTRT